MRRLAAVCLLVINLNTATVEQLRTLPGIGPALAQKIINFREKNHGFKRVEELLAVPGISEKKWKAIRDKVGVGPAERNGFPGNSPPQLRRGGVQKGEPDRAKPQ
jgi:competence ComEA-like helix-hairpin-helix protein